MSYPGAFGHRISGFAVYAEEKERTEDTGKAWAVQDETGEPLPVAIENEKKEDFVQDEDFETVEYDLAAAGLAKPPQEVLDSASAKQEPEKEKADPYQLFSEGGIVMEWTGSAARN